jgi:hypothetical protein
LRATGTNAADKDIFTVKAAAWALLQSYATGKGYTQIVVTLESIASGVWVGDASLGTPGFGTPGQWFDTSVECPVTFTSTIGDNPFLIQTYTPTVYVFSVNFAAAA